MPDKKEPKPKAEKTPKKPEAIKHYIIASRAYKDETYTFVDEFEGTLRQVRQWPNGDDIADGTYYALEDVSGPIIKSTKTETVVSVTSTPPRKRKASV